MISVCLASHNGGKYILPQINSILSQLSDEDELIISDDGSEDNTIGIIKSLNDARIKILEIKPPKIINKKLRNFYYATCNFENSIKNAKGDYIFLSDQDDIWYDNKIQTCLDYLREYDYVKHDYSTIDKKGEIISFSKYDPKSYDKWNFIKCLVFLPFRGCCMAFRKDVIKSTLPFPKNCFQHDSWIGMNAIMKGYKFKYINLPLIYHRIHGDNVSELIVPNSLWFKIKYRIILSCQLLSKQLFDNSYNKECNNGKC